MNRRAFLSAAAAAPALYGLRDLLGQDAPAAVPAWFTDVRRRMDGTAREAVVCVVPGTPAARMDEGRAWCRLLQAPTARTASILCEAYVVLLTPELARRLVREDAAPGDRFHLASDGLILGKDRYETAEIAESARFVASFGALLHGADGKRLEERAALRRRMISAELREALDRFDHDDPEIRSAATRLVGENLTWVLPCLAWMAEQAPSAEAKSRASDLLLHQFRSFRSDETGPRLPYGAAYPNWVSRGCGQGEELPDELKPKGGEERCMVACGMARVSGPRAHTFVTFLSQ